MRRGRLRLLQTQPEYVIITTCSFGQLQPIDLVNFQIKHYTSVCRLRCVLYITCLLRNYPRRPVRLASDIDIISGVKVAEEDAECRGNGRITLSNSRAGAHVRAPNGNSRVTKTLT